jgi:hypothetical protein
LNGGPNDRPLLLLDLGVGPDDLEEQRRRGQPQPVLPDLRCGLRGLGDDALLEEPLDRLQHVCG